MLEAASLVTTMRRGREKLHYLNAAPVNAIAERWISQYDRERARALADLKAALEEAPMGSTEFVYTTYISTTPERLWQALTDPAFTRRYWAGWPTPGTRSRRSSLKPSGSAKSSSPRWPASAGRR